jgi:digeranylgeranylglycerophospholipid reductase
MTDFDIIVVGAGPAGSVAARSAAEGGARVLLLDKKEEPGVPVQCGELLPSVGTLCEMFPRAPDLEDLFEVPKRCISLAISRISIYSPARREYDFGFEAMSLWRAKFDQHLAKLAAQAGAEVRTGVTVRAVLLHGEEDDSPADEREADSVQRAGAPAAGGPARPVLGETAVGVETEEGTITASYIIGADGPLSRIRRSLGVPAPKLNPCVQYTIPGDFGDAVELYFPELLPGGHVWLVPRSNGANIGLETRVRRPLRGALDLFVWNLGITDKPKIETQGMLPVSGPVERTVQGNVLLCGDAAGQVLAFNGWGMATAMICGRAAGETAAQALAGKAPLSAYEARWRSEVGDQLKSSYWIRRQMDRLATSGLTMELAFAFLRRWGIKRLLGGKRIV